MLLYLNRAVSVSYNETTSMYVRDYTMTFKRNFDITDQLYLFRGFPEFTNTVVAMETAKDILDMLP